MNESNSPILRVRLRVVDGGYSRHVTRLLSILFFLILPLAAQEVLTSAAEVANFPGNDPEAQPGVSLEATVTHIDPSGTIFLADATGATFLSRVKNFRNYSPGQVLSVKGVRNPGLYIGGINPSLVEVVGNTPPPAPRSVTLQELSSGRFHYQLVSVDGIARSVKREGETSAVLQLSVPGGIVSVRIDQAQGDLERMVDAELSVTGLAAGGINDRRQLIDPYIMVASPSSIELVETAPEEPPVVTIPALSAKAARDTPAHRVRIEGTALSPEIRGSVFLRGEAGGVRIVTGPLRGIRPGGKIIATGFPTMGIFSPELADATVVLSEGSNAILPRTIGEKNTKDGSLDADLVSMEATLVQSLPSSRSLLVSLGDMEIQVFLPGEEMPEFSPGSKLRLTGIWQVTATTVRGYQASPSAFSLWLREKDDITLLSAPPWWTPRRLAILLGIISAAALLSLVWAAMLRLQVSKQVKLIEEQTQQEAVLEERQRIAREFHDTLEQELAGLSLRLDAALPRVPDETANSLLSQLRKLLFRLQTETRDFVWDLRDESRAQASFEVSLEKLVDHLQATSPIPIRIDITPASLPALQQHHLLRITREAIHNATKYSRASVIEVTFRDNSLRITDDGIGFESDNIPSGHFGIQGMRERAKKINATLDVSSTPSGGTTVTVNLP